MVVVICMYGVLCGVCRVLFGGCCVVGVFGVGCFVFGFWFASVPFVLQDCIDFALTLED